MVTCCLELDVVLQQEFSKLVSYGGEILSSIKRNAKNVSRSAASNVDEGTKRGSFTRQGRGWEVAGAAQWKLVW